MPLRYSVKIRFMRKKLKPEIAVKLRCYTGAVKLVSSQAQVPMYHERSTLHLYSVTGIECQYCQRIYERETHNICSEQPLRLRTAG
jgi:uncharacterized protein (DUF169 family)